MLTEKENKLNEFYNNMYGCALCPLRKQCTQVVVPYGQRVSPTLMVIGDFPTFFDDRVGEPFKDNIGEILRDTIRQTKILNPSNTLLTNVVKCKSADQKGPKKEIVNICLTSWLFKEIELLTPKRLLLLGNLPLSCLLGLSGITKYRGQWFDFKGIRTMATIHPSYVYRMDQQGNMQIREFFESDIFEMAKEVKEII